LTLDVTSGAAEINVTSGNHTIATSLSLAENTVISISPAASGLSITGPIIATGLTLTKEGEGTLTTRNIRAAELSILDGTLVLAPGSGVSVLNALTFNQRAQAVPEPETLMLITIGAALAGLVVVRRRRRCATQAAA
jgi:hypothetical protein